MSHTPGPWHTDTDGLPAMQGGAIVRCEAGYRIAETYSGDVAGGNRSAEANARLIAAAPEMYDALKALLEDPRFNVRIGGNPNAVESMYQQAIAAIAKAEGR